jgi:hypothetical protein
MNETLGTHSDILAMLLDAATKPVSSDLSETLKRIAATLGTQTEQLLMIGSFLARIDAHLSADS